MLCPGGRRGTRGNAVAFCSSSDSDPMTSGFSVMISRYFVFLLLPVPAPSGRLPQETSEPRLPLRHGGGCRTAVSVSDVPCEMLDPKGRRPR